jgi:hypothetical protein
MGGPALGADEISGRSGTKSYEMQDRPNSTSAGQAQWPVQTVIAAGLMAAPPRRTCISARGRSPIRVTTPVRAAGSARWPTLGQQRDDTLP